MTPGRALLDGLLRLLYPPVCDHCHGPNPAGRGAYCPPCRGLLAGDVLPACPRCAATVGPNVDYSAGCPACRGEAFPFATAVRMGRYDGHLRDAILRAKHQGPAASEYLADLFADAAGDRLRALGCDAVVPVPLHWRRRFGRGYNQAAAAARVLAERLGVPCRPGWLRRVRPTPQLAGLSASARRESVRGAFRAGRWAALAGRAVLLVDDVMTSGSTCAEAAGVLRRAGANRVAAAVFARAG